MPYTPTGRPVGRPKTKNSRTVSLKMPQDLLDRVQRYARMHRQSVSALIRDGLEWRITEFDALVQPVHLSEEGLPCDEALAGAPQTPAPEALGEPWSRQAVVARILRWRQEGLTKTAIAAKLNSAHVPPLAGTGRWNLRKVTRALWEVPKNTRERHAFLARYAPTTAPAPGREG
jgi:Ribbon-helix-helix protein, copG family